jgi:hypothetical protein
MLVTWRGMAVHRIAAGGAPMIRSTAILVLTAAAFASAVHASSARIAVTNLSVELIDLTPDDGDVPSMSWATQRHLIEGRVIDPAGNQIWDSGSGDGLMSSLSAQVSTDGASFLAAMALTEWLLQGEALLPDNQFDARAVSFRDASRSGVLGAHSRLVIAFDVVLDITAFDFCSAPSTPSAPQSCSTASADFGVSGFATS